MPLAKAEKTSHWLLSEEDCDCDDRRFYCSYLISHSSLCLSESDNDNNYFAQMEQSLMSALATDQLSELDRSGINSLWNEALSIS
jgi:hypothetical protein